MIIDISDLKDGESKVFQRETPMEALEWVKTPYDVVEPCSPISWKVKVQLFDKELLVRGYASMDFEGLCCRCGQPMRISIGGDIDFSYEIGDETMDVDLTNEIRDAILLNLPSHPLCSDDCEGLCPTCGEPLSKGTCTCKKTEKSSVWDALDTLL